MRAITMSGGRWTSASGPTRWRQASRRCSTCAAWRKSTARGSRVGAGYPRPYLRGGLINGRNDEGSGLLRRRKDGVGRDPSSARDRCGCAGAGQELWHLRLGHLLLLWAEPGGHGDRQGPHRAGPRVHRRGRRGGRRRQIDEPVQARRPGGGEPGAALQRLLCLCCGPDEPVRQPVRAGRDERRRLCRVLRFALHGPVQAARYA